jgi:hypothetical protein
MKLTLLLCALVCLNTLNAKQDAASKLTTTAKKLRTAKIFYSDEQIKNKIIRSMEQDEDKWTRARREYLEVVNKLKEMQIDVQVPATLDELLIDRVGKDADKILIMMANHVKRHSHS